MKRAVFFSIAFACGSTLFGQSEAMRRSPLSSYAGSAQEAAGQMEKYVKFGDHVEKIVSKMKEVAEGRREASDLRALEFLLRDYDKAVAAGDLKSAGAVAKSMYVYLVRGGHVASEAGNRKAERKRADAERRHKEELAQRERHHREQMEAQARALEELRLRQLRYLYGF